MVIEKEIRDRLGVKPGWQAVQLLVDNQVRIYFIPPEHKRSLRGAAKPFIRGVPPPEEEWDDLVAKAVAEDYLKKWDEE